MRREDILNFLRVNQILESTSDEEISRALISAKWNAKDAETAVLILRGKVPETSGLSHAQRMVSSDVRLSSETIGAMLGLHVSLKHAHSAGMDEKRGGFMGGVLHTLVILITSVILALGIGMILMYYFEIGPYFSSTEI
jgi:hypothetical protein